MTLFTLSETVHFTQEERKKKSRKARTTSLWYMAPQQCLLPQTTVDVCFFPIFFIVLAGHLASRLSHPCLPL